MIGKDRAALSQGETDGESGMSYQEPSVGLERREYYSSSQGPFHGASSLHMFYGGGDRGNIVDTMLRSLRSDDAILHVHGEPGSGKTMLSLVLAEHLAERHNIIRYDHEALGVAPLLRQLLIELRPHQAGLVPTGDAAIGLESHLLDEARRSVIAQLREPMPGNRPFLLLIDAGSDADASVLQLIDELTSVRRDDRRALQVILFQRIEPEASRTIGANRGVNRPENHYWLRRLTLAEISEYLRHHMMLFDFTRRDLFSREMAYFVADRSEGVFRAINTIARNAFVIAGLQHEEKPTISHLLLAGLPPREIPPPRSRFVTRHRRAVIALIGSSVVASALLAVLLAVR